MLTYLMVLRLIQLCPNAIILKIGAILEPLRETFQSKAKDICPIGQVLPTLLIRPLLHRPEHKINICEPSAYA